MKKIAVVTGASSGFGKEFVKLLLREPGLDEIWAIARNQDKLHKLKKNYGDKIQCYSLDLSSLDAIMEFEEILRSENPRIKYMINNAGFAKFCSYKELSVQETINMINLNCGAVAAMTVLAIPYMQRGSRLLNISSQSAFQPLPYLNVYSSTKVFVRNYTRAINVELKGTGITATAVCPGWMKTALYDRAKVGADKAVNRFAAMVTPDKVAKKALYDAKHGSDISVYGLLPKLSHLSAKILPQKLMMKLWLMQQQL